MYSRKSAGPKIEPSGTLSLTGCSYEDFSSRTTRRCLLLRKDEINSNIWHEITQCLSLWRRQACQTLSKALDISIVTARVAQDLLKPQPKPMIYKFFKDFANNRKKPNSVLIFSCRPFPNILKNKDHQWDLLTIQKTRLPSDTYCYVQLVCMKVQALSSLEPPPE